MDRQPVLQGDRLTLRPLRSGDWDALFAVACDREIWAGHPSHDRWQEPVFRAFFDEALASGGALAIIDKLAPESGTIIGSTRFGEPEAEAPGEIEIGWSFLARAYWGLGYNADFKRLMLVHALAHYDRAIFQVGADNAISRKAMANIGGRLVPGRMRSYERCGVTVDHVIYEITRESFAQGPLSA
ncbi:GNAT family N-acetyltransferase [Novosphingobium sp. KN65.2]|uniref:GNAT family N-acetyltransferase n=1 Tax=Novosphingobium sp. KN65.2 TaxID=1478134 RepID=UPI0005E5CE9F|nr:GNAT family N-acetyltransferase [Novosphingobium sp. KN65.2]CDO38287.1 putative Acetyltransferase [Novosphingobium sp. KN65.2]